VVGEVEVLLLRSTDKRCFFLSRLSGDQVTAFRIDEGSSWLSIADIANWVSLRNNELLSESFITLPDGWNAEVVVIRVDLTTGVGRGLFKGF